MEVDLCYANLRKAVLSIFPVNEKSLKIFLDLFSFRKLQKDEYLSKSGDYPSHFAFICEGIIRSYYKNLGDDEIVNGIFIDNYFVLPLPSFIFRKPAFLNFQAVKDTDIMQIKFSDFEALSKGNPTLVKFMQSLIVREWIVKREMYESGIHVYNPKTRFNILKDAIGNFISSVPAKDIASYLRISEKQLLRYMR
ncbi:MAG: Crp/Fnr family transcriptional regulator [Bacteroidales bacterium]|nr:Crp/Fnr family transcriptional regulator [Bacteroidales bacterium]